MSCNGSLTPVSSPTLSFYGNPAFALIFYAVRVFPRYSSAAEHEEAVLARNWNPIFSSFQFPSFLVPGWGLVLSTRRCVLFQTSGPRQLGSIQICHEVNLDVALRSSELSLCRAGALVSKEHLLSSM